EFKVNKKHFMSSGKDNDILETDTNILTSKKIKTEDIIDDDKLETNTNILTSNKIKSEDIVDLNESSQVEGSTQWRLHIKNVPKFASTKIIKDLLAKHSCGDVKIKKSHDWNYCYAFFKTQEQQLQAIDNLKNVNFKNKTLVELYNGRPKYKPGWALEKSDSNLPCLLQPMIPSPILEGYRNKCEFTVGRNLNGEIAVGFLLGAFKNGINSVI
ncbi:6776_t:CDS:2, partial [Scutellospora calospora]